MKRRMRPALRWWIVAAVVIAAAVALSLYAIRKSPVAPSQGERDAGANAAGPAAEGPGAADAGAAPLSFEPLPEGDLHDPEPSFQVVLLPLKKLTIDGISTARALAKTSFPGLRVQRGTTPVASRPALLVGEVNTPAISNEELQVFGRGLNDALRGQVAPARRSLVLEFHLEGAKVLPELRQSETLVRELAGAARAIIFDGETHEYFTLAAWEDRRIAAWTGELPQVPQHVLIEASAHGRAQGSVTFGMSRFGLPDFVAGDYPPALRGALATVLNLAAQTLVERGRVDSPGRLWLDIAHLQEPHVREAMQKLMRGNARGRAELLLGIAEVPQGDPHPRLIAVELGRGEAARGSLEAILRGLFGP